MSLLLLLLLCKWHGWACCCYCRPPRCRSRKLVDVRKSQKLEGFSLDTRRSNTHFSSFALFKHVACTSYNCTIWYSKTLQLTSFFRSGWKDILTFFWEPNLFHVLFCKRKRKIWFHLVTKDMTSTFAKGRYDFHFCDRFLPLTPACKMLGYSLSLSYEFHFLWQVSAIDTGLQDVRTFTVNKASITKVNIFHRAFPFGSVPSRPWWYEIASTALFTFPGDRFPHLADRRLVDRSNWRRVSGGDRLRWEDLGESLSFDLNLIQSWF